MKKMIGKAGLAIAMAATALAGMTAAAPAEAQRWGGGYRGGWHGGYGGYHRGGIGVGGAAVLGGLVGLGVGAAIADSHRPYYAPGPYYGRPYYGRPYYNGYYGGYYAPHCWDQWRWDPYWGREVPVRVCN